MAAPRTSVRVATALVVVLTVAVGAFVVRSAVEGGPSDDAAACGVETQLDGLLPEGDVRLAPFAADSPWKTPVLDGPLPDGSADSEETRALRAGTGGVTGEDPDGWVNAEEYSFPLVQADACDPEVSFEQVSPGESLPDAAIHVPEDAAASVGTDRHLMVIQPDHRTLVELWGAENLAADRWKVGRVEVVDLEGSGIGPDNGVRAYGGSAVGGLIRRWEVDPSDPNFAGGVIDHPLAIALPSSMLRYEGGDPGYDADGYGMARGYVWPATEQDFDSPWTYGGPIPMGSRIVLPESVDIDALDLPPALRTIALALQQYGAYVTDRTGEGTVAFYAEPTVPTSWLDEARGPSLTGDGLDRIRAELVVVP